MTDLPSNPQTLQSHLSTIFPTPTTRFQLQHSVLPSLLHSISNISRTLRSTSSVSTVGTSNAFGDAQLNVDVLAEQEIRNALSQCPSVVCASSEEDPVERSNPPPASQLSSLLGSSSKISTGTKETPTSNSEEEKEKEIYTVAFDPLDGSSIIAPNWSVGAIIGIWDGSSALHQDPSTAQIGSILGVFGPRTTAVVALRIPGCTIEDGVCFEVSLDDDGMGAKEATPTISVTRPEVRLTEPPFKTRYFAPANLRAAAEDQSYMELVTRFIGQKYTLRYSGGLVPDIVHALVKGHGIYVSPVTDKSQAKLRRLYELAPVALIVECAGGVAVDAKDGRRVLEREIRDTDERGD
ncbi:sedoheptulose-1,7-bisphosphatase-like protein [Dendryphion nanum]|uniref:Sedoheptulose-1,7-bisphosphatase-like protein n=1 Tax=Dendryphion nanum TaxID=256645 RepID=A0A9P9IKG2_9PLEO|nr:sedoheptulose-1,7-bisphosphatase-like protein [Dendryphion nanum]